MVKCKRVMRLMFPPRDPLHPAKAPSWACSRRCHMLLGPSPPLAAHRSRAHSHEALVFLLALDTGSRMVRFEPNGPRFGLDHLYLSFISIGIYLLFPGRRARFIGVIDGGFVGTAFVLLVVSVAKPEYLDKPEKRDAAFLLLCLTTIRLLGGDAINTTLSRRMMDMAGPVPALGSTPAPNDFCECAWQLRVMRRYASKTIGVDH
jgi:hypothetical protein